MSVGQGIATYAASSVAGMALATTVSLVSDERPRESPWGGREWPSSKDRNEGRMLVMGGLFGALASAVLIMGPSPTMSVIGGLGLGMAATTGAIMLLDRDA